MGAAALPNISKPPVMLQPYSSSSRLLMFSLASDKVTPIEKSVIARWTLQPRLLGVPGVANVAIWGFRDRQLQVQVDPERLRDKQRDAEAGRRDAPRTRRSPRRCPSSRVSFPGTGGFIETPQQRLGVRHVFDKLTDPKELSKVPVEGTGGKRPPRRRDHRRRGPPAADRRRGRERRRRADARRREVPRQEHARGHPRRRGRARRPQARSRGHGPGHVGVPACDLHRGRDRQPHAGARDRGHPARAGRSRRSCSSGARC